MTKTVVHYTDAVGFGGAEKMLLTLIEGLDRTRWRPVLLYHPCPSVQQLETEASHHGIDVIAVPGRPRASAIAGMSNLVPALRAQKADLFHAHLTWGLRCTQGLLAAFIARVPYRVVTQQLFMRDSRRRRRIRQRAISAVVDRYIAVSEAMAVALGRAVIAEKKVRVVHNGIDPQRFTGTCDPAVRKRLTGGIERPVVLTLARLDWHKGLQHLIAAACELPQALFVVAGEGRERARLEAELTRLRLEDRFRLLGHRDDVPELLAACDVFVLPSLLEGLPVSILEAMAAEKPVVASAVGGIDEAVVDGATGLLVPPGDAAALAAAIRRVISDVSLRCRLGTAGRARVEQKFSARAMVTGVEHLYDELLAQAC